MSALKFLTLLASGTKQLVTAITTSAGVSDANKILATNSTGKIDISLMPPGIDISVESIVASEAISAGDFVNIWDDAGTRKIRQANSNSNRPANGFVLAGIANGATGAVYVGTGLNTQLTGLTIGSTYYLGAAGDTTNTPPTAANSIVQSLGFAVSTTSLKFEYDEPILLA